MSWIPVLVALTSFAVFADESCRLALLNGGHHTPNNIAVVRGVPFPVAKFAEVSPSRLSEVGKIDQGTVLSAIPEKLFFTQKSTGFNSEVRVDSLPTDLVVAKGTLYRGKLTLSHDEAIDELRRLFQFGTGRVANPSYDVKQHIDASSMHEDFGKDGTRYNTAPQPTGFFSTTKAFTTAVEFGPRRSGLKNGYVLEIEGAGVPGIDIVNLSKYFESAGKHDLARSIFAESEQEVMLFGIDPRQIRGAWVSRQMVDASYQWNGSEQKIKVPELEFIENPNFDPAWVWRK